jgi:hypothetical protein
MSFRPKKNCESRISDCEFRIAYGNRNPQFSCSGRDSNSDRALIWCLQGISLPLCPLSYRSEPYCECRIANLGSEFQIRNSKFDIRNLFLVRS